MLYFVFTVDGDWEEYYSSALPDEKRKPDKQKMLAWFECEIRIASDLLNGKFIHFIHTSPFVRDFFLQSGFILKWKEIEAKGGNVGVHCHEDEPHKAYYFDNAEKMSKAISFLADELRRKGLNPIAYRGGYLAFSPKTIPILEQNGIFLDFSCAPDRYLLHENLLVADWRGAPDNFYRMAGNSKVFEIPLGIYIETDSLWKIWQKARELKQKKGEVMVSVLSHSYEFGSYWKRLKIKLALLILKIYGKFIEAREAEEVIKQANAI